MKIWYLTERRFIERIIKRWEKRGFCYHAGHLNILRFAFRSVQYWSIIENQKISKANLIEVQPKLF